MELNYFDFPNKIKMAYQLDAKSRTEAISDCGVGNRVVDSIERAAMLVDGWVL